ncbi:hypothetical protein GA0070616_5473 [Micromonospora nigra]|uniref:Uncharacterized protein n=1 Tax=Micromonospora nigra TaxID=145857 RepID=A0A1C6T4Q9_9ACTN|nr:hypothetical protein [Micromonospora nigra]SCL36385.1 hypothetical protein GA0070616_5473 [Micromonospora nigra]
MSDNSTNYGIHQSGGVSQVGNQAVGPGAHAVGGSLAATTPTGVDVPALLAQLLKLVEQHRAQLPQPAHAVAAELRAQLGRPDVEPARVTVLLHRLAALASPVAPVAAAVTEVLKAVQAA